MTWLRGTVTKDILSMIVESQTASEVWRSIEEHMLPTTKEHESWLKCSLYSLKKGNTKLKEFLKKFKSLCDNLAAIGKSISDEDKVFQLERSLGPNYADFKTTMLTKPPYPTIKQFILALQIHEQTVMVQKQVQKALIQAFFGQRGRRKKNNGGSERAYKQNNRGQNQNKSPYLRNIRTTLKITKENKKNA